MPFHPSDRFAVAAAALPSLSAPSFRVLVALLAMADDRGEIRTTWREVAAALGVSWRSVARAVSDLTAADLIEVVADLGPRGSIYRVRRMTNPAYAAPYLPPPSLPPHSPPSLSPSLPPPPKARERSRPTPSADGKAKAGKARPSGLAAAAADSLGAPADPIGRNGKPRDNSERCSATPNTAGHRTPRRADAENPPRRSAADRPAEALTPAAFGICQIRHNKNYVRSGNDSGAVSRPPNDTPTLPDTAAALAGIVAGYVRAPKVRAEILRTFAPEVIRKAAAMIAGKRHAKDPGALFVEVLRSGEAAEALAAASKRAAVEVAAAKERARAAVESAATLAAVVGRDAADAAAIETADPAAVAAALRRVAQTIAGPLPARILAAVAADASPAAIVRGALSPFVRGAVAAALRSSPLGV